MFRAYGYRRSWLGVPLAIAGLLAVGWIAIALRAPGNVTGGNAGFEPGGLTEPATPSATGPATRRHPADDGFRWPIYGLTPQRTKYLPLARPLRPPFVERWRVSGAVLLEFTPVLCGRRLFLLKNNGALYAISRLTGRVLWKLKLGVLAASSPACDGRTVYAVMLQRGRGIRAGRITAADVRDGRVRWSRRLPSRSESSPLLLGGGIYFGSEDGTVYNLDARSGAVRWTYRAGGAVKGGIAADGDRLVFGDYSGTVTALRRSDGSRIWATGTSGSAFGLRAGTFYGTPAIAYGRVFIGNTDGFMYAFGLDRGRLAWRHRTGGYVYSGPAVSPAFGGTVYAGSYDRYLYAFDARTGRVRWRHYAGGRIVGSPVVIGDLVFYANLGRHSIGALGAANGRLVWSVGRGAFSPVISDGRGIYLNGYSTLYLYTEAGVHRDGSLTRAAQQARSRAYRRAKRARHERWLRAQGRRR